MVDGNGREGPGDRPAGHEVEEAGMTGLETQADEALVRAVRDDDRALAELFARHRDRLWRMVRVRLDRRLLGRVDPDDILQEAYLDAAKRIEHFRREDTPSFFLWLRLIVGQTLVDVHRRHLGAQARDAGREVSIHRGACPDATSASLAGVLVGRMSTPSRAAIRAEAAGRIEEALDGMEPIDREVLVLRHFEELTNGEVAEVLGIQPKAASIRYVRAVARLKAILSRFPEFADEAI
jgi:RNA polymerase sigma-70 factor (ECF subfamily)